MNGTTESIDLLGGMEGRQESQLNQETLQERLQDLIQSSGENWTYAVFWQVSQDLHNNETISWGDGYYEGETNKVVKKSSNSAEQEYRKRVLGELNTLISGGNEESNEEEVTDTEWFFLVSMTQSFVKGVGLPGESFLNSRPIWLSGPGALTGSGCERAGIGQSYGIQTMVCIPVEHGVVELGSTEVINQSSSEDLIHKTNNLFNSNDNNLALVTDRIRWCKL